MDEAAFHNLISGEKRGLAASVARGALGGMSLGYSAAVGLRNRAFDSGMKRVHYAAVPVVSVGNITTGGTGKTPMVAWLVHWLQEQGVRPVILSRGYHAKPGETSDEKLVLEQLCPGVPHLQNPDRISSSQVAIDTYNPHVLVLDDGFQHRQLARDLDIVLIDALNPFGYGRLLPRGLLREPLTGLRRADLIVITRADQCSDEGKQRIIDRITAIRGDDAHAEVAFVPECLVNSNGETADFESLNGKPVTAFCGIGNPAGFARTIADCGLQLAEAPRAFRDHHQYATEDLESIGDTAKQQSAAAIVTTQKDLVKIDQVELGGIPLWAIRIGAQILAGKELVKDHLNRIIQ